MNHRPLLFLLLIWGLSASAQRRGDFDYNLPEQSNDYFRFGGPPPDNFQGREGSGEINEPYNPPEPVPEVLPPEEATKEPPPAPEEPAPEEASPVEVPSEEQAPISEEPKPEELPPDPIAEEPNQEVVEDPAPEPLPVPQGLKEEKPEGVQDTIKVISDVVISEKEQKPKAASLGRGFQKSIIPSGRSFRGIRDEEEETTTETTTTTTTQTPETTAKSEEPGDVTTIEGGNFTEPENVTTPEPKPSTQPPIHGGNGATPTKTTPPPVNIWDSYTYVAKPGEKKPCGTLTALNKFKTFTLEYDKNDKPVGNHCYLGVGSNCEGVYTGGKLKCVPNSKCAWSQKRKLIVRECFCNFGYTLTTKLGCLPDE